LSIADVVVSEQRAETTTMIVIHYDKGKTVNDYGWLNTHFQS